MRRGAKVAAMDMRLQSLQETKALAGARVATFLLDVTDRAAAYDASFCCRKDHGGSN